jgi:hypothetical protein
MQNYLIMIELNLALALCATLLLIGIVLGLIILISRRFEKGKTGFIGVFISIISTVLTLFGIVIAIADNYLSQYDYDVDRIKTYEKQKKEGIVFNDLVGEKTKNPPEYIFVLDVSGSTTDMNKRVKVNKTIEDIIENINSFSGRMGTEPNTFKVVNNEIPYCELLRVRLLYLLMQMEKMKYDKTKLKYSIVYFAGQCKQHMPSLNDSLSERISNSFRDVLSQKFDGMNTDFVKLFEFINEKYLINCQDSNSRHFDKKDYIVVFLSDYMHDVKKDDLFDAKKNIKNQLKKMENANANFKYYLIMDDEELSMSKTVRIDKIINSIYEKENHTEKHIHHPSFNIIDLREMENTLDYPMILSAVFPFFYSNSVFEDSLKTKMVFRESQELSFRLENYAVDNRHEISLWPKGESKKYHLSNNNTIIPVRRNDTIEIRIVGYIPSPYKSPDIVIEDSSKGVRYILPVVFYKNFPTSGKWLLNVISVVCLVGIIVLFLLVFVSRTRRKK